MDAEEARQRFLEGAVVLLLEAPANLIFGIDQQVFLTGSKFAGVKMIPPGPHALTTTLAASDKPIPTVMKWLYLHQRQVYVARWHADSGRFSELEDKEEAVRYELGVRRYDFDSGLAPYPDHTRQQWRLLTSHLHEDLLKRILPSSGFVDVLAEANDLTLMKPKTRAEQRLIEQLEQGRARMSTAARPATPSPTSASAGTEQHRHQEGGATTLGTQPNGGDVDMEDPDAQTHVTERSSKAKASHGGMTQSTASEILASPTQEGGPCATAVDGENTTPAESSVAASHPAGPSPGRCRYTKVPRSVGTAGMTAEELTRLNMDKSPLLVQLFGGSDEIQHVLGELQFAFIAFLVGQSLEGFLQWKALLGLLLSCDNAATRTHTSLYTAFLGSLCAQLSVALPLRGGDQRQEGDGEGDIAEPMSSVGFEESLSDLLEDSFLQQAIMSFLEVMVEERDSLPEALWYQSEMLRKTLQDRLGWTIDDALYDEGPVVVDLI